MEVTKAQIDHAKEIGRVHSMAWKQAYADVFPDEYIKADTPEKREQEFLSSYRNQDIEYYLICEDKEMVGIIKINSNSENCEIESLYILEEYRNKGYGHQAVTYLKKLYDKAKMQLWVLEYNREARHFYEKNGFKKTGMTRHINRGNDYKQLLYEYEAGDRSCRK